MNPEIKKWLVRGGSLLILLGFVLPSLAVSCTGMGFEQSFSLATLSTQEQQFLLLLVPFGVLAIIVLSFLPARSGSSKQLLFWGQIVAALVGFLGMLITVVILYQQIKEYRVDLFQLKPEYGFFIFVVGYLLVLVGLILQIPDLRTREMASAPPPYPMYEAYPPPYQPGYAPPPPPIPVVESYKPPTPPPPPAVAGARLQLLEGNLKQRSIFIQGDDFTIGRSLDNDLVLPDPTVSRQHARLRNARGMWFIQDQESAGGILVNGKRVKACQLYSGDEIEIGDTVFRFIEESQ